MKFNVWPFIGIFLITGEHITHIRELSNDDGDLEDNP